MRRKGIMLQGLAIAGALSLSLASSALAHDRDNNPPGPRGGPGTNWENPPGPRGGPGASPDRHGYHRRWRDDRYGHHYRWHNDDRHGHRYWWYDRDDNPPGPRGGPGTNWENPPGPRGGPGASPDRR